MPLIQLIIFLVILGVIMYLINTLIPMDASIKTILNVVVILVVCLWLLSLVGVGDYYIGPHH